MEQDISLFSYLISMLSIIVIMGLVAGVYAKFMSILVGILAYPTYLAIYGLEFALAPGVKTEKKIFGFNMPKSGNKRFFSHGLAAFVTLFLLFPLGAAFVDSIASPEQQINFVISAMYGRLMPPVLLLFPLAALCAIYGISWFCELDENSPMEKIENLTVPSLWKKVMGE